MDFPLNPCPKLPHRGRLGVLVFQDGRGVESLGPKSRLSAEMNLEGDEINAEI